MTGGVPAALASGAAISAVMGVRRLDPAVALARVEALRGSIRRMDRCSALGAALARAGVPVAPDVFLVATLACAGSMGVVAWTLVRSPVVSLVAAAAVGVAGWSVVASAERRYLDRFSSQLPVVAQQLAGAIGAGLSLRQAIARAARDAPEPAASELRALSADLELGARIDTALQDAVARLPDPGLRTMVTAIIVQRVVGEGPRPRAHRPRWRARATHRPRAGGAIGNRAGADVGVARGRPPARRWRPRRDRVTGHPRPDDRPRARPRPSDRRDRASGGGRRAHPTHRPAGGNVMNRGRRS